MKRSNNMRSFMRTSKNRQLNKNREILNKMNNNNNKTTNNPSNPSNPHHKAHHKETIINNPHQSTHHKLSLHHLYSNNQNNNNNPNSRTHSTTTTLRINPVAYSKSIILCQGYRISSRINNRNSNKRIMRPIKTLDIVIKNR